MAASPLDPCFVADRQLMMLRVASTRMILPLSRAAAAFVRRSAWTPIGYLYCGDFARERLGRSGRWLTDLAVLGDGLVQLPTLKSALCGEDGGAPLSRVAATALSKFATIEVIDAWIDLARRVTVREFLEAVRQARAARSNRPLMCDRRQAEGSRMGRTRKRAPHAKKCRSRSPIRCASRSTKCSTCIEP